MVHPSIPASSTRPRSSWFGADLTHFRCSGRCSVLQRSSENFVAGDVLAARVAEVEAVLSEPLEAHRVAEALGAEATQVLEAAHAAAAERAERAEREAEAIRAEALTAADTTRAEAIAAREETLAAAERDAEEVAEDGRQRGRDMVNEAQAVRERMLSDLARKRQTGRAQVEQLRGPRPAARVVDDRATVSRCSGEGSRRFGP